MPKGPNKYRVRQDAFSGNYKVEKHVGYTNGKPTYDTHGYTTFSDKDTAKRALKLAYGQGHDMKSHGEGKEYGSDD